MIGVLAKRGAEFSIRKWRLTGEYLTSSIPGYHFVILPLSFEEIHDAVREGRVEFVLANSAFYVELEKFYGVRRIATLINCNIPGQETTVFGGVIFTRADRTDINTPHALRNRTFMAVDPRSFGGWHVAWRELRRQNIDPFRDLSSLQYGDTHDAVVYAVLRGDVDAGTVRTDTLERMAETDLVELNKIKVLNSKKVPGFPFLLSTDLYPEWPMAAVARTPDKLARLVSAALMSMQADDPAAIASNSAGWTIPLNYQPVHDCLLDLRLSPYADYGKFTLADVLKRYWREIGLLSMLVITIIVVSLYILRLNRNLVQKKAEVDELNRTLEDKVIKRTEKINSLLTEKTENYEETIYSFVNMIEQRDTYTAGHTWRVARYCKLIAQEMHLADPQVQQLQKAAILHDIGKISTPDSVLLKPGKLERLDYDLIKLHVVAGYKMLSQIKMYKDLAEIIRYHHERYDGMGYPDHLQGEQIPLLASVMVVADAFDAMTTTRIYKARKSVAEAIAELRAFSGSQFHPEVVKAAVKVLSSVEPPPAATQMPKSELEKRRFSYFYNDRLTGLYNEDYLKIVLQNNLEHPEYSCMNIIHLKNLIDYNKREGWEKGNNLLKRFAEELQAHYPQAMIFRIYGNDFAVITSMHLHMESQALNRFVSIRDVEIDADLQHVDLVSEKMYTLIKADKVMILPSK
jgi:putative nucleotidyltransferase with HDIG domain